MSETSKKLYDIGVSYKPANNLIQCNIVPYIILQRKIIYIENTLSIGSWQHAGVRFVFLLAGIVTRYKFVRLAAFSPVAAYTYAIRVRRNNSNKPCK